MKCGNCHFLLCPLCFNLPHQLLPQWVISQNDSKQLPENGVSQQKQPVIPFCSGAPRLINRKTIRCIITISNAKLVIIMRTLLCLATFSTDEIQNTKSHPAVLQCRAALSVCSLWGSCWFYSESVNNPFPQSCHLMASGCRVCDTRGELLHQAQRKSKKTAW